MIFFSLYYFRYNIYRVKKVFPSPESNAVKNQKGFFYQPRWDYESLAFSIFVSAISESEIEQNFKNFNKPGAFIEANGSDSPNLMFQFGTLFMNLICDDSLYRNDTTSPSTKVLKPESFERIKLAMQSFVFV